MEGSGRSGAVSVTDKAAPWPLAPAVMGADEGSRQLPWNAAQA